jgi:hypothetical protein
MGRASVDVNLTRMIEQAVKNGVALGAAPTRVFSPDCRQLQDPVSARPSLVAQVVSLSLRKRIDFRICQAATCARLASHTLLV